MSTDITQDRRARATDEPPAAGSMPTWLATSERVLFPRAAAERPAITPGRALVMACVVALGLLLSLLRHGIGAWTTIWAEDGEVFLTDALATGLPEALLDPYAGYLHVIPRVVAEVVSWFPVALADTLLAGSGAALAVLAALVTYRASEGHIRSPGLRLLLAVTVLLVPTAGAETPNSIAYSQWYLAAAGFWVVLWRPRTTTSGVAAGSFLGAVALSAPILVLASPVVAMRGAHAWRHRSAPGAALVTGAAIGIAVQMIAVLLLPEAAVETAHEGSLKHAWLIRVTGPLLPGPDLTAELWLQEGTGAFAWLTLCAIPLMVAPFVRADARVRTVGFAALGLAVVVLVVSELSRNAIGALTWPGSATSDVASRYTVVPVVLVVSAVLVRADLAIRRSQPARASLVLVATSTAVALSLGAGYDVGGDDRLGRGWDDRLASARLACGPDVRSVSVPIAPTSEWTVEVPCERLRG
ncbi:MAG TPA: hypothetical protein VGA69_04730 [Nitriliruptorales bacterium]